MTRMPREHVWDPNEHVMALMLRTATPDVVYVDDVESFEYVAPPLSQDAIDRINEAYRRLHREPVAFFFEVK